MYEKITKRFWGIAIFSFIIAMCLFLITLLSVSTFSKNYSDIKMQQSIVINTEKSAEIETSLKNGKEIEKYYGIEKFLNACKKLYTVSTEIAIISPDGHIIASTFSKSNYLDFYSGIVKNANKTFVAEKKVVTKNDYTIMIQPIKDKNGVIVGNYTSFCLSKDLSNGLENVKKDIYKSTEITIGISILVVIFLLLLVKDDKIQSGESKDKKINLLTLLPVIVLFFGIAFQSVHFYNVFYSEYRQAMFEGATEINDYIGNVITEVHAKGVPYEEMNELSKYLAEKSNESQILWNVQMDKVLADSKDIINNSTQFTISKLIDKDASIYIEIEISKQYIDAAMKNMLLLYLVTLLTALIIIWELIKFPLQLEFRNSVNFGKKNAYQFKNITVLLRICTFLLFLSSYMSIPFSALLVRQWNSTIFNLPKEVIISFPITIELLAIMLGPLFLEPIFKKLSLSKIILLFSGIFIIANGSCFFATNIYTLVGLRFLSGIGTSGVKFGINNVISYGSDGNKFTKENLSAMNSGALAGITAGASLGGVVATTLSVNVSYLFTAGLALVFAILTIYLFPWNLIKEEKKLFKLSLERENKKVNTKNKYNLSILKYIFFIITPFNMGIMFIVSFLPNFIVKENLSNLTLSVCYLINGMGGIYLSTLAVMISKKINYILAISLVPILCGVAIFILNFQPAFIMVLVVSMILGIFDGFGAAIAISGFLEIDIIKKTWERTHALTVAGSFGSGIQTISPIIYGIILSLGSVSLGLATLGGIFIVFGILYLVLSYHKAQTIVS